MKRNAKVVAFISGKGGVGKTTLISNLGALLASRDKKVLFIDLDYQANLTSCMNKVSKQALQNSCISRLFKHDTKNMRTPLPSDFKPAKVNDDVEIFASSPDIDTDADIMQNANPSFAPYVLLHLFTAYKLLDKYDYILVDCHNSFSILAKNALVVADKVVTPVTPSRFGISAVKTMARKLNLLENKLVNPATQQPMITIKTPLFVGNMIDFNTKESHDFEHLVKTSQYFVAGFHRRVLFSRATTNFCSVFHLAKEDADKKHRYNNEKAVQNEIIPEYDNLIKAIDKGVK